MIGINKINFKDKNILIVGGTGSFGNQFLKNIIKNKIKFNQISILSRDEKKQYDMREKFNSTNIKFHIGDIRDTDCTDNMTKGMDYIFHAAALKQVPSCEFYPMELYFSRCCSKASSLVRILPNGTIFFTLLL